MKPIYLLSIAAVIFVPVSGAAVIALALFGSGDFELSRFTIDGGGVMFSTGGDFELSGTIGQPDAGALSGGDFTLTGGFWFPLVPGDLDGDGGITLADYEPFTGCMSGEGGALPDPSCGSFDSDGDGDIDLRDYAHFADAFSGP